MEKKTVKQVSILGLVLIAASAVTAAMVPNKSDNKAVMQANGSLTASTNGVGGVSCSLEAGILDDAACNATEALATNAVGGDTDNGTNFTYTAGGSVTQETATTNANSGTNSNSSSATAFNTTANS